MPPLNEDQPIESEQQMEARQCHPADGRRLSNSPDAIEIREGEGKSARSQGAILQIRQSLEISLEARLKSSVCHFDFCYSYP